MIHFNRNYEGSGILIWYLTESIDELVDLFSNKECIAGYEKIVSEKRKKEYLGVRAALKHLLGNEFQIVYDNDGKPFLKDSDINISISHSKDWIAVMYHLTEKVGVDIEVPSDKISKLAPRFLSPVEIKELSANGVNGLLIAWCAKEAMYKLIGKEAVDFSKGLRVHPFELNRTGTFGAELLSRNEMYKLKYFQDELYTLVFCYN